jgi:hypothetical protein
MVFCFVQNFFRITRELEYFFFFVAPSANFFFQSLTLGYMTKTLKQIISFSSTKIRIFFFQQHWESEYFFRKKTYLPPAS